MQEGKAIIFSAPSGSGKTTIVKHLLEKIPTLEFSISATSRLPRENEKNGRDYHFLSSSDFEDRIKKDRFIEWEEVYTGTKYGTLKSEVQRIWDAGHHVIFDVDVIGGINLKRYFGEKALSIFIGVPDVDTLKERLKSRGTESDESFQKRIEKAEHEMTFESQFDETIINDDLKRALGEAQVLLSNFINQS